jgi:hypothetical protein
MTLIWHPVAPIWMLVLAGVILAAILAHGSRTLVAKNIPRRWILLLAGLRGLAILIFLLALARPEITYIRNIRQRPDLLLLVDTSKSMGQADRPGGPTRLEHGRSALLHSHFAEQWLNRFQVHAFAFDATARPLPAGSLDTLRPEGENTLLADSLAAAWDFYRQGRRLADASGAEAGRILLVSDGLDRGTRDAAEAARRLGPAVDVLAQPVVESPDRAEVAIAGVQTPGRVALGAESRLLVTVRRTGAGELPLTLSLLEEDQPILDQPLVLAADQAEVQARVAFRPTSAGLKTYALRLTPRTPAPGLTVGPPHSVTVRVESRKAEALLLEDTWRWEFPFLRRVFEADPQYAMTAFLARGRGIYMQFGEPDRRVTLAGFPQTRAELAAFDLFVLGDVNPAGWAPGLPAALHDLVVEEGKSLVVLAGPRIGRLAAIPALATLLPVEFGPAAGAPLEGPIAVRLSPDAADSPLFFTPPDAAGRWKNLPALDRLYAPIRKKPAATVLIEAADRANDFGRLIVAAEHTVGRGRVLIVCTDTFWKWQLAAAADPDGNTPHRFFWQQALRALQPARLAFGNVQLWIQGSRTQIKTGQTVTLEVEIEADRPVTRPVLEANVTLPDGRQAPLAFAPSASNPARFHGEFEPSQPGRHLITATVLSDGRTLADQITAVDVLAMPPETAPAQPDADYLAHLAAATGGRVIAPDDPATWPAADQTQPLTVQEVRTVNLWSSFILLLLLTAVLGLDWFLRLLRGYV